MLRRTHVFGAAAALILIALALTFHQQKQRRDFSQKTTITMGTVVRKGALLKSRRSSSQWFCWVSYDFTPPDSRPLRNWRLWEPACGVAPGRPIPIEYVVAQPQINRPAGGGLSFPTFLLWFAAGVAIVFGTLLRGADDGI